MDQLATQLWSPWLAYGVVGVAALLTLATVVPQLRGWAWARGMLNGQPDEDPSPVPMAFAASAGVAAIAGTAIAITIGGAGALIWMWIAIALGLGLHFAEGILGARRPTGDDSPVIHLLTAPGVGGMLAPFFAVGVVATLVLVAGLIAAHETTAVIARLGGPSPGVAAIVLAVATLPFVAWSRPRFVILRAVPFAVGLYSILAVYIAFDDPLVLQLGLGDAVNEAFGLAPAAGAAVGSGVALAVHHGVAKAVLAGGPGGLGVAALAAIRTNEPRRAGAAAMFAALGSAAILTTATGFVMLGGERRPIVAANELVPLETVHSRGLRPSQQVGQTIVLPEDTYMQDKKTYGVLLRSNPRGHAWGQFDAERNAIIMPGWTVAENTTTVAFRPTNKDLQQQAAWDVRLEFEREVRDSPGGEPFVKLTPKDPDLDLQATLRRLSLSGTPYVVLDDFHFIGAVGKATSLELGEHLAMYEAANAERPFNPKLHEFFRVGYRGPYPDDGRPRPPWALVSAEGFSPEPGRELRLRLTTGPRGAQAVAVTRSGGAESPPWDFLLQATELVLRHADGPDQDVHIAVTPRLDDYRVRYEVADKRFEDLRAILTETPELSGPFVVAPDFEFDVEVRTDTRLPEELAGRRALIPLHDAGEPSGPPPVLPYTPHPAELLAAGFSGPYLADDGAEMIATRFDDHLGGFGRLSLAAVMVLLTLSSIAAWAELGGRAATALLGSRGPLLARAAAIAAIAGGAYATRWQLWSTAEAMVALTVIPSLLGLALLIPKIRARLTETTAKPD